MSIDDSLSDILDVEPISSHEEQGREVTVYAAPGPAPFLTPEQKIDEDAELARQNIRLLLTKGSTALSDLIKISAENQHPRSFEVVATMLKTLSEMNHDLLDTHKTKQELTKKIPEMSVLPGGNTTIHQAVFFGSTAELSAALKQQRESEANGHSSLSEQSEA